jgi:prepilin-type N-terminal cleavage/methylation domain-containing protein
MNRPAAQPRRAFTLVEVLVVVAIIGIAGAIVVPQMLRAGSLSIQAAGRSIIADLLYAQNDAIAMQSGRRVVFDVPNNRYRLTDAAGTTLTVPWKSGVSGNYVVDFGADSRFQGVKLTAASFSGQAHLEYDDLGAPSTGGTVELEASGFRYRITVAPMTGRVSIAPIQGE